MYDDNYIAVVYSRFVVHITGVAI